MALINDAGKLRHKATFIVWEEVENSRGIITKKKKDLFTCYCNFVSNNIRDMQESVGAGHTIRKTIIIRSKQRFEINNLMHVRIKGKEYQIHTIIPDDDLLEYDTIILQDVQ